MGISSKYSSYVTLGKKSGAKIGAESRGFPLRLPLFPIVRTSATSKSANNSRSNFAEFDKSFKSTGAIFASKSIEGLAVL